MIATKKAFASLLLGALASASCAGRPAPAAPGAPPAGVAGGPADPSAPPTVAVGACAMEEGGRGRDAARTVVYASRTGVPSLYFAAKLAVNTDGASRSYHPDDPRGEARALNNVANAISHIYAADGTRIDCRPRRGECFRRYVATFEAARDAGWNPTGHPRVETDGMIPWRTDPARGWKVPCLIASGPAAGYFVSQTAFAADPGRGACDQDRYLDSLRFNAIVLPRGALWASQGVVAGMGDLVVVRHPRSGTVAFAIAGDRGPETDVGEGTIALAAALAGRTLAGTEAYAEIKRLALADVDYVVFPGRSIRRDTPGAFTQADVDRAGRAAFDAWGGVPRLEACRQRVR